jgi:hypothetical protein
LKTPKALANFSPGFELARTLGSTTNGEITLKGFANHRTLSGLHEIKMAIPWLSLARQPWAEISERLRRFSN